MRIMSWRRSHVRLFERDVNAAPGATNQSFGDLRLPSGPRPTLGAVWLPRVTPPPLSRNTPHLKVTGMQPRAGAGNGPASEPHPSSSRPLTGCTWPTLCPGPWQVRAGPGGWGGRGQGAGGRGVCVDASVGVC